MVPTRVLNHKLNEKIIYHNKEIEVILNMKEYLTADIEVNIDGNILNVKANYSDNEQQYPNTTSYSKNVEKKIILPEDVETSNISNSISSTLDKSGFLIIKIPRLKTNKPYIYKKDEFLPQPKVILEENKIQITLDCRDYKPEDLEVKVEGQVLLVLAKREFSMRDGGIRWRVLEQKFTLPKGVIVEKVKSNYGLDRFLTITAPRDKRRFSSIYSKHPTFLIYPINREQKNGPANIVIPPPSFSTNSTLPNSTIQKKFTNNKKNSHSFDSIKQQQKDSVEPLCESKVEFDEKFYKIFINIQDFQPEDLVIKTLSNIVLFEAKSENPIDGNKKKVCKKFELPYGVNPELVTSNLSKDGILIISTPLPTFKST